MTDVKAFKVESLPCPECGRHTVIGYQFEDEDGNHMHTKYVCIFWPKGTMIGDRYQGKSQCGWTGWTVPGWDGKEADDG